MNNITRYTFLLLFFVSNHQLVCIAPLRQVGRIATVPVASTHRFSPTTKSRVENIVAYHNIRPDVLEKSDAYFCNTDGYEKILDSIESSHYNQHFCKGYLFELETACNLCEQSQDAVEHFHRVVYRPESPYKSDKREIDIITNRYFVECKYHNWLYVKLPTLKKQLGHQRVILKAHNAYYETSYKHLFCSKTSIPNTFKQFCIDHAIEYKEIS